MLALAFARDYTVPEVNSNKLKVRAVFVACGSHFFEGYMIGKAGYSMRRWPGRRYFAAQGTKRRKPLVCMVPLSFVPFDIVNAPRCYLPTQTFFINFSSIAKRTHASFLNTRYAPIRISRSRTLR